jgi:hypothetical protein
MIWYSPELDEFVLVEITGLCFNEEMPPQANFGLRASLENPEETFSQVAWYYIGEL